MPLFRKKNRDEAPVDMNARSPKLGVKYKDLMVLDQLVKNGADLSASRHVVYYSYAPTELVAQAMAREAESQHFNTVVREPLPQYPDHWTLVCDMYAVTTPEFVRESDDFFEGLAGRHSAVYDGWEAAA
jgi:Regulator of ribonuclease activity B